MSKRADAAMDEEAARAEVYALLAQLFYAPPSPALLDAIRSASGAYAGAGPLGDAWQGLVARAGEMDAGQVREEYDALFGGVGKPEVSLYGSQYLSGFLNEKPLARLRTDLAALGFERPEALAETEDHIACICDTMRELIQGDDAAISNLEQQRIFYCVHVQPWVDELCDAVGSHSAARFYAALARFAHAFFGVEAQAFDMLA